MRKDSVGLFWEESDDKTDKMHNLLTEMEWVQVFPGFWVEQWRLDNGEDPRDVCVSVHKAYALAKASKTGEKRTPPDPVWLADDYLPNLDEAMAYSPAVFTTEDMQQASLDFFITGKRHRLVFDIECYRNYFLIAFKSLENGKYMFFERYEDVELHCDPDVYLGDALDLGSLRWVFENFQIIGFNSYGYDIPIASLALAGKDNALLKAATDIIIGEGERGYNVVKRFKAKMLKIDHIDIIEVAPLSASLKIYGGRVHTRRMQDLPFPPEATLAPKQAAIVRWYCGNDLDTTIDLYNEVEDDIELRVELGHEYGMDLRSKSDAQIAEAVIRAEIEKLTGQRVQKPTIAPGTVYKYHPPAFLQFQTPLMNRVMDTVRSADFIVSEKGSIGMPKALADLQITMNKSTYTMGIGGLHSTEKSAAHFSGPRNKLIDRDVTSYYPFIILNLGLFPHHLGTNFLTVYWQLVDRRLTAKSAGDKKRANSLKIVINGSFGKLGSAYSVLYSPNLLIQTTVTGQLSLLMLIERLELAGIEVVSANTDGVVIKPATEMEATLNAIVAQWEADTGFTTEETRYAALFSRDVNNYIAVMEDKSDFKGKGIFAKPDLKKNPQSRICIDAIGELLLHNKPIAETIRACDDITKFITVRAVKGGAVKDGVFLGKAIRWYYSTQAQGEIVYAKSGNKVPKSDGAAPLMLLPQQLPEDVDYDYYVREANSILRAMGHAA